MQTPNNLRVLRELIAGGQAPELPVWITNNAVLARNLTNSGSLALMVVSDHWECDWDALCGLDVIVAVSFYDKPVGTRIMLAIRDACPDRLRMWIQDVGFSTMALAPCASMDREDIAA